MLSRVIQHVLLITFLLVKCFAPGEIAVIQAIFSWRQTTFPTDGHNGIILCGIYIEQTKYTNNRKNIIKDKEKGYTYPVIFSTLHSVEFKDICFCIILQMLLMSLDPLLWGFKDINVLLLLLCITFM